MRRFSCLLKNVNDTFRADLFESLKILLVAAQLQPAMPSYSATSAQICAQILGPEGQNEAQPDATGFGDPKQKPLKTGAQVALWREETQSKLVEAVGVEPITP